MKLLIRQRWWWNVSTSSTTFTPLCCCLLAHTRLGTGYLFPAAPVARLPLPTTTQPQEEQLTLNITDTQLSHNLLLPAAKCVNHNFAWCNAEIIMNSVSNFAHKKVQRYSSIIVSHFTYNLKLLRNCYLSVSMQVFWTVMCNSMVIRYSTGYSYYAHNNVTAYWKHNKETTLLIRWIWYTEGFLTFVSRDWRKPYSCSLSGSNSRFVLHRIVVVSNLCSYKQAWNKVFQLQLSAITPHRSYLKDRNKY